MLKNLENNRTEKISLVTPTPVLEVSGTETSVIHMPYVHPSRGGGY